MEEYKYVDFISLGYDFDIFTAEWAVSETKRGKKYISIEPIQVGFIGQLYYDILFYAFIY